MKATAPVRIRRKSETLNVLLDELGEECQPPLICLESCVETETVGSREATFLLN